MSNSAKITNFFKPRPTKNLNNEGARDVENMPNVNNTQQYEPSNDNTKELKGIDTDNNTTEKASHGRGSKRKVESFDECDGDQKKAKKNEIREDEGLTAARPVETNEKKVEMPPSPVHSGSQLSPVASSSCLSPDQVSRMELNKARGKLLRFSKQFPVLNPDIGVSWLSALEPEFSKPYFGKLSEFVVRERSGSTVYPTEKDVWSWTMRTNIADIRVVILGQDPYHGPGQAHGLCFSVLPGVAIPPSLLNMYKELESDIAGFTRPKHGYLAGWADQGVLLLNACLTVRRGQANSHKEKGWEKVTDAVIRWLSNNTSGLVFLLWGASAQKKAAQVDSKKHHLLKAVHPSPLSAHRGFLGCKHFSKCNEILQEEGKRPIDWSMLPVDI